MVSSRMLALSALAIVSALPLRAQERGLEVLNAAATRYGGLTTICADFVQVLDNPLLGDVKTSRGRLCQRRPNLFRMDFSDPDGDRIVADGDHVWLFYRSMHPDQVLRLPVDPTRGGLDFFREFLSDPASKYEVHVEDEETVDGRATLRLALSPRSPRGLESARVWVDPEARLIRRLEVIDENGLIRRVSLSRFAFDPELAADHFRFVVPDGVDVVSGG